MPTLAEKEPVKKERKPISNLPQERLNILRQNKKDDEDSMVGFSPIKKGAQGKNKTHTTFLAAWDDHDHIDIDFTTE